MHPISDGLLAIIWLTRLSSVLAAPVLLTLWPAQFPVVVARIAIERLRGGCYRATAVVIDTTPTFLSCAPDRLPILRVVFVAIERIACPASVCTTPLLLMLRPLLPVVVALCAILDVLRCRGHNSTAQVSVFATPTFLLG